MQDLRKEQEKRTEREEKRKKESKKAYSPHSEKLTKTSVNGLMVVQC